MVLTILGAAGMGIANLDLSMTGNEQAQQLAFQAAETGIELALSGPFDATAPVVYTEVPVGDGAATFDAVVACAGRTRIPDAAYSETATARAIHFEVRATGRQASRQAVSAQVQGIYIVAPAPATVHFDPAAPPGDC